jgi:hypothetical protein
MNASVSARRGCIEAGAPLATLELLMTHRPFPFLLVLTATIALGGSTAVHAGEKKNPGLISDPVAGEIKPGFISLPHLRSPEPQMRALIEDAIDSSATVRALVERITASDVVVFVVCERDPAARPAGRLNFITSAGGLRYVVIRLRPKRRAAVIAMLAHELQHAAEIADTPSIVDEASLAREYERIGYRSHASHGGVAFDTKAAVDIGRRVAEELTAADGGPDKVRATD